MEATVREELVANLDLPQFLDLEPVALVQRQGQMPPSSSPQPAIRQARIDTPLYHEGAEVTAGRKYVLRTDLMYRREGT